jgi:hypothetical protein
VTRRPRAAVVAVLLALGGCGVPTGGPPTAVPASEVPYGLLSQSPQPPAPDSAAPGSGEPAVYLLQGTDRVVARARQLPDQPVEEQLQLLLDDLAAGPAGEEAGEGLTTALAPDVGLVLASLTGGTATVDAIGAADVPIGRETRPAVAQVVLTATSLPGVSSVRLLVDGAPVDAPLPSGRLTDAPLTAADYLPTVASPTS